MTDFHSSTYLSPASDVANLLLTSVDAEYLAQNWDDLVFDFYQTFYSTVLEFGINLKRLGTSFNHFKKEVLKRLGSRPISP